METFANVRYIIRNGADWFKSYGTQNSPGTKAFSVTGNVKTLVLSRFLWVLLLEKLSLIYAVELWIIKKFKAVQIGGPSGGCLTEEHLDMPLDFDSLQNVGAMIGSGGMVVMDEDTCMVEVARFFYEFYTK